MTLSRRFGDPLEADEWERDEPAFQRRPRRLPLIDSDQGVSEVRFADTGELVPEDHVYRPLPAGKPRWTRKMPTVAGWYFVRPTGTHHATVVKVERAADGRLLYGRWTSFEAEPIEVDGLEWGSSPVCGPMDLGSDS